MTNLDVTGIGNAIVDVIARADDTFLEAIDVPKGSMRLIDADEAESLYDRMGPGIEVSGGSVANAMAGLAAVGGRAGFIGRVRDDTLGRVFSHDLRSVGVRYTTAPASGGLPTARCLILVTPDAQRTLNTFLGASTALEPADLDVGMITDAAVTFLEGYLWDRAGARAAVRKAAALARENGRKVALSLSDPFCVERHAADFHALLDDGGVDILLANEDEAKALTGAGDVEGAVAAIRERCPVAAVTRSEKGAVLIENGTTTTIEAAPVSQVVDTTGAGDLFAAGFLYGLTAGRDVVTSGRIGAVAAAEAISHFGARPETDLKALIREQVG